MAGKLFDEIIEDDSSGVLAVEAVSCRRIGDARTSPTTAGAMTRVSSHTILAITEGAGSHVVEMATYDVDPSVVLHLQPGQVHRWEPDQQFDGWVINVRPRVCPPGLFDLARPAPLVSLGSSIEVAHALVTSLTEPGLLPGKAQERLRISIASLLLELLASASEGPTLSSNLIAEHAIVSDFRRELEFHYLTTRSVNEYASLIGCSPKTLTRATKRVLGQTPKQIIDTRVVYAATRLLANTDISISWISSKLGFTQQSNFAKFFARQIGVTPAAYRKHFDK